MSCDSPTATVRDKIDEDGNVRSSVLKKFSIPGPPPRVAPSSKRGPGAWKLRGSSDSLSI